MSRECSAIPAIPYHEFSRNLHEKIIKERIPVSGVIEVTRRCNLDCVHCYISGRNRPREYEMTPSEWNSIFASLARRGTLWILVTGGEPLLRPDLPEILKNLKLNGMLYTLFTNGALIDERIIHHLLEWRPFSVEVSVYGASAETYRRITGSSEAFAKVLKGIDMLIEAGLRLELKTVLMSLNKGELDSIRKIADDRGVPFRFDTAINKSMGSGKQPELYRLEPEEIAAFDLADPERLGSWLEFMERKPGARRLDYYYHCGAGVSTFAITPEGKLNVCGFSDEPGWDLRKQSFDEGWDKVIPQLRERKVTRIFECRNCELLLLCGHCAALAKLETGDPQSKVDYFCSGAKIRSRLFNCLLAGGVDH